MASPARRIVAHFLSILLAILTLGIGYAIWGLVVWDQGQTPALQVLGMRCWQPDRREVPGWWTMALREVVGHTLEGFIVTAVISLILMLARPDHRTLHDLIASTVVVHDPNRVLAQT